ncbi:hypothetical protein BC941DRAFT_435669 [Chlamydoabsidia padenii]|nr:hypothetical protein BC941DRAFT_435669 [Chlamydoabsidia padenii]
MEHPGAKLTFRNKSNEYNPDDQHGIATNKSNIKKGKAKAKGPTNNDIVNDTDTPKDTKSYHRRNKKQPDPDGLLPDDVNDSEMINTFMSYFDLLKNGSNTMDDDNMDDEDNNQDNTLVQERQTRVHKDLDTPSSSIGTTDHHERDNQQYDYDDDDDDDDDEDDDLNDLQEMDRIRRKFDRQLQRMFGGTISQMNTQFRSILNTLKTKNDPTMQLVALQELAEILSVSNEETLAGYFSCDNFVKELVRILKGTDNNFASEDMPPGMELDEDMMLALAMSGGFGGGGNPETMLLACRCLSNLMDALPTSVTNVVYHGATKVLCEKLKSIEYIDLAEQALIALEKISSQLPRSVISEGGLSAALMYFDFFSTHSQRTALRTTANCLRSVDKETFSQVEEAIPTLMNTIAYPDRTVVELSCLCWLRITENYRPYQELIEKVVSVELLKAVMDLIPVPGNANAARPSTFTDLLRILRAIVKSSPSLCCELLKLNIVDVFYKVLTGSSVVPMDLTPGNADVGLDHKWRDSVYTILKVIIDTLPPLPKDGKFSSRRFKDADRYKLRDGSTTGDDTKHDLRTTMLTNDKTLLQHINILLIPLLLEMHTSMVNIRVRQLVTHILVKLIYFTDQDALRQVLKNITLSGFLASILTQKEHPILVMDTLYVAEMLIEKLPDIYLFLFQHEGVIHEIKSISSTSLSDKEDTATVTDQSCDTNKNEGDSATISSPDKNQVSEITNLDHNNEASSIEPVSTSTIGEEETSSKKVESGPVSTTPKTTTSANLPLDDKTQQQEDELRTMEDKLQSTRRRLLNMEDLPSLLRGRVGLLQQQQRAQLHRQSCADNEKGIGHGSTKRCITQLAKAILDEYNGKMKSNELTSRSATSISPNYLAGYGNKNRLFDDGSTEIGMETLQTISQQIRNSVDDPEVAKQSLKSLLTYAKDCGVGISSFELRASGLMDALVYYLTDNNAVDDYSSMDDNGGKIKHSLSDRQTLFKSVFGDDGGEIVSMLILRLQELLARFEQYQVVTPLDATSSDSLRNPSSMLSKQLRLRLGGIGSNIPIDHQHLMVSTHAVATFQVIEDYLLSRIALLECEEEEDVDDNNNANEDYQDPLASNHSFARRVSQLSTDGTDGLNQGNRTDTDVSIIDGDDIVGDTTGNNDKTEAETSRTSSILSSSSVTPPTTASALAITSDSVEASSSSAPANGKWHIKFSIKSTIIPNDSTIYSAIHRSELEQRKTDNSSSPIRNIWISSYPISFERVWISDVQATTNNENGNVNKSARHDDPPDVLKQSGSFSSTTSLSDESFSNDQICDNVLRLLKALYSLYKGNNSSNMGISGDQTDLDNAFHSRKLAAKVNRQLEEPLITVSGCLPDWMHYLMREAPFLFPFETRYLFIQSTSYGYSHLISRWQSLQMRNQQHLGARGGTLDDSQQQQQQSMALGRVERQKVRMMRSQILESAVKMLDLFATSSSSLEIEFVDEEGTGLGPTLEFYALASKEFYKKSLGLWRDDDDSYGSSPQDDDGDHKYVSAPLGLFPRPIVGTDGSAEKTVQRTLTLFKTLGRFLAKAMLDFRIVDIHFSATFFDLVFGKNIPLIDLVRQIDPTMAKTINLLDQFLNEKRLIYADSSLSSQQKQTKIEDIQVDGVTLDDLCLSFIVPGTHINLKPDGDKIPVTIHNLSNYIDLLLDSIAGSGVSKQIEAFRSGFNDSFQIDDLKILTSEELVSLFGSSDEDWSLTTLTDTIKADHGFTMESTALKHLLEILSELDRKGRRDFLQFATGSPRLPIGGWKALRPAFTVVRKIADAPLTANDYLPSVMTCANYLKMPEYSDKDTMRKRLQIAMDEGKDSFLLS